MALDPAGPGTRDVPGPAPSNSVSGTVHGPVTQIGVVHGDVNLTTGTPVRTRYRETVRRIAPRELIGREAELADLAEFCTSSPTPYRWVRAEAWSGKSALMSTFALNPPPGVRVVSFFITARMAAQNDRNAFIDNVLEQLVTLLDQPLPPPLTESTREAHLLGLLTEATEVCRARGEHFVLLVDGLDEDRGVTTGPDAHSIAALLPVDPPAGLRVVVAGRPNPSIPTDVPDHHPLRAAEVVRPLAPSPAAQAERSGLERELKRLLRGTATEQDLLGLLTAAGGGLTAPDLAELVGLSVWDVEDHLRTVTGRSFSRREGDHDHSDAYALGHEELHKMAVEALGHRLAAYRGRLHEWADRHRARRWPNHTPQYLLHDYFAVLRLTDDVVRMLACATDPDRHDLMLDRFGGDGVALAEIIATQSRFASEHAPDLVAIGRLAVHRDRLAGRNASLPRNLPGLWASLGRVARAVALAESFGEARQKDIAYLSVVRAISRLGADRSLHATRAVELTHAIEDVVHRNRALAVLGRIGAVRENVEDLLDRQEAAVRLIEDRPKRDRELAILARSAARFADLDRTTALVESIADDAVRARAQGSIAVAVAASGELDRALALAEQVTDPTTRVRVTAEVAIAFGESGDVDRARRVLAQLTGPGCDVPSDREATTAVHHLAVLVGDQGRADELEGLLDVAGQGEGPDPVGPRPPDPVAAGDFQRAREMAELIPGALDREVALVQEIRGLAGRGELAQADSLTSAVSHSWRRRDVLAVLIPALIAAGEHDLAVAALHRAEVAARGDGDVARQDRVLISLVTAVAGTGDLRQAEKLARAIADPAHRANALTAVSRAAFRRRDPAAARRLRADATVAAHSTADVGRRDRALAALARAAAAQGDLAEAGALADSLSTTRFGDPDLPWVARFPPASEAEEDLAASASHAAAVTEEPHHPPPGVPDEVASAIASGDLGIAAALTPSIADVSARIDAISAVVTALVTTDAYDRAQKVAVLTDIGRHLSASRLAWHSAVMSVVRVLMEAGEFDLAEQVARTSPDSRGQALWRVVGGALRVGDHDRANAVADSITGSDLPLNATRLILDLEPDTARRAVARGLGGEKWHKSVGVLARLSPVALEAVVRELVAVDGRTRQVVRASDNREPTPD